MEKLYSTVDISCVAERRKRLGQYFTGRSLGRILAALADAGKVQTVIDPMCGSGDLLSACLELGANPSCMGALDIDPIALGHCRDRLPQATCVLGSAFDPNALKRLPRMQWDLVITNPPYVRYQSLSKKTVKNIPLPGAVEIRKGLLSEIEMLPSLDETDRELFRRMVQGYSGLADLAVPSWILCAGLVTIGGRLALVVPESWLSRDYAAVVQYILLRWFEIEFIVEDEHAAWFPDAQVKTTLLVAKRIPRKEGAFNCPENKSFLRIAVSGKATGPNGPCSYLNKGMKEPEMSFADEARSWLHSGTGHEGDLLRAFHVQMRRIASSLQGVCKNQKWFTLMKEPSDGSGVVLPHELEQWLSRTPSTSTFVPLSSLGIQVGQGLRTGANNFFYADRVDASTLVFKKLFSNAKWIVPEEIALPVIRKQSDLPTGFLVSVDITSGRVLDLRSYALPEDIKSGGNHTLTAYAPMPESLAVLVRKASLVDFGKNNESKRIWELSAVAPNIRKGNPAQGLPTRFWYMLPDFARRHRPDLFMARINSGSPKAYLNKGAECLIDANFSTLWSDGKSALNCYVLLALLNSSWTAAVLEHSASVMGGGALKVEATHLRRLPVPLMQADTLLELTSLGKKLSRATNEKAFIVLLHSIDAQIVSAVFGKVATDDDINTIKTLAEAGRAKRKKHKNKGTTG